MRLKERDGLAHCYVGRGGPAIPRVPLVVAVLSCGRTSLTEQHPSPRLQHQQVSPAQRSAPHLYGVSPLSL